MPHNAAKSVLHYPVPVIGKSEMELLVANRQSRSSANSQRCRVIRRASGGVHCLTRNFCVAVTRPESKGSRDFLIRSRLEINR